MLHYKTRRLICRIAFVACCALPSAGVIAWAGWLRTAGHVRQVSNELSTLVHAPVRVAGAAYPQPGLARYSNLVIEHPETRRPMLRATEVETGGPERSRVILVTHPEVEAAALAELLSLLEQELKQGGSSAHSAAIASEAHEVRLHAAELTLRLADRTETLTDLVATLGTIDGNRAADLQFRVRGLSMPQPARVRYYRRSGDAATTGFALDTGEAALPLWVAGLFAPWSNGLGEQATFRGQVVMEQSHDGWQGEVQGVLTGVALKGLVPAGAYRGGPGSEGAAARKGHRLDGLAEVRIKHARFSRSRLESMSGSLVAGPGFMSQSLVVAAVKMLEMTYGDAATTPEPMLPYDQLAFAFALDGRGLQLLGLCAEGPAGAVAVDRGRLLLGQSPRQPAPVAALVRTLLPQSPSQVPANRHAAWLLEVLPLGSD
jgi:hypothetical protein